MPGVAPRSTLLFSSTQSLQDYDLSGSGDLTIDLDLDLDRQCQTQPIPQLKQGMTTPNHTKRVCQKRLAGIPDRNPVIQSCRNDLAYQTYMLRRRHRLVQSHLAAHAQYVQAEADRRGYKFRYERVLGRSTQTPRTQKQTTEQEGKGHAHAHWESRYISLPEVGGSLQIRGVNPRKDRTPKSKLPPLQLKRALVGKTWHFFDNFMWK